MAFLMGPYKTHYTLLVLATIADFLFSLCFVLFLFVCLFVCCFVTVGDSYIDQDNVINYNGTSLSLYWTPRLIKCPD